MPPLAIDKTQFNTPSSLQTSQGRKTQSKMRSIKNLITGYLFLALVFAVVTAHHYPGHNAVNGEEQEKLPIGAKINWKPILDDEYHQMNTRVNIKEQVLGACDAPNGHGLKNLLQQAKRIIPFDRIKEIVRSKANDPEVRALRQLIRSAEFRDTFAAMRKSSEFINLRDYACYKLNLDTKDYEKFVNSLLDLSALEESPATDSPASQGYAGIRGLLLDIHAVLPRQQLVDLYERLKASDVYLARAVHRLQSEEFKRVYYKLRKTGNFRTLRRQLIDVGVPLGELKQLIDEALGWADDDDVSSEEV